MKQILLFLFVGTLLIGMSACSDSSKEDAPSIEDLQKQIEQLKSQLEANAKITAVAFEGDEMVLTFADKTVLRTAVPNSVIPTVGDNGNWFVNGKDLGIKAKAEVPVIGPNNTWVIDGVDTGVTAEGSKGDKGDKGDNGNDGRGIDKIAYDETTGVLTITLTDQTKYDFQLAVSTEGGSTGIGGNKIEDLNGAYLLTAIKNGDMPFMQFTYDAQNMLTEVGYYQNVANEAVKIASVKQSFENGKLKKQTLADFAEIDKTVLNEEAYPGQEGLWNEQMVLKSTTPEELFNLMFPGGIEQITTLEMKEEVLGQMFNAAYEEAYIENYGSVKCFMTETSAFLIHPNMSALEYIQIPIAKQNCPYMLKKKADKVYFYTHGWQHYDAYNDDRYDWVGSLDRQNKGYLLSNINVDADVWDEGYNINVHLAMSQDFWSELDYKCRIPAVVKGNSVDVVDGNKIFDYEMPAKSKIYNPDNITGDYKFLMAVHRKYKKGDEFSVMDINYVYDGENFTVNDGEQDHCFIEVSGNKITGVTAIDSVWTDNYTKKVLRKRKVLTLNYNSDGTLSSIDSPEENLTNIATCSYDNKGNMTQLQVNASKLKGKGYDDELCVLGLAYRYHDYDEALGGVVQKVKYTDGALLRVNYNYGLKNFMNHSWVALNPLFSNLLNNNNAFSELIWVGHGSCFVAEYLGFNEGGYPTKFKGLLQIGGDLSGDVELDYPINGSVATMYNLEYKKKN